MKNLLLLCAIPLCLSFSSRSWGQIVINEVLLNGANDVLELKNLGTNSVDVSSWWICYQPTYRQISDLTVSGSTTMAPGAIISISGATLDFNASQEDVGLYSVRSFSSAAAMVDFVQYGAGSDIGRTDVAVAKGIWTLGEFVATPPAGQSIQYDGSGNGSTNWVSGGASTIGGENIRLDLLDLTTNQTVIVSVLVPHGLTLDLEATENLVPADWQMVTNNLVGGQASRELELPVPMGVDSRYFRLREPAMVHPKIGQTAELIERFHDVAGTCTIVDEDTIEITGFNYDATGVDVRVVVSTDSGYSSYTAISGDLLRANPYVNETLILDHAVPLDDIVYISIWCIPVGVSFGDGVFN